MKKILFIIIGSLLVFYHDAGFGDNAVRDETTSLFIQATPGAYSLATEWAATWGSMHPDVNPEVTQVKDLPGGGSGLTGSDLWIVSDESLGRLNETAWKMAVGRLAIVPVIHVNNPYRKELYRRGITVDEIRQMLAAPGTRTWGSLLGSGEQTGLRVYAVDDGLVRAKLAGLVQPPESSLHVAFVRNGAELVAAIRQDPCAVGFCALTDVIDRADQTLVNQIRLLPIDKNRNGKLDRFEAIYGNLASFARGVWIGKYPSSLTGTVYAVSSGKPVKEAEVSFLRWVLTGGQQVLDPVGFRDFTATERQTTRLAALATGSSTLGLLAKSGFFANKLHGLSVFSIVVIALIPFLLAFMIYDAGFRKKRQLRNLTVKQASGIPVGFNESTLEVPGGLYFDKTHTWAFMEKNGWVRIGIDDFLQHVTGEFTRVKFKRPGEHVRKGEPLLSIIQNGKQLTLHAPVSGIIKVQNGQLERNSSLLNTAPYTEGWVYLIEPANWAKEIRYLFMANPYKQWLEKEFSRLKDFLAVALKGSPMEVSHVILQDGGEVKDGVLTDLGPEIWEEFQIRFIDENR